MATYGPISWLPDEARSSEARLAIFLFTPIESEEDAVEFDPPPIKYVPPVKTGKKAKPGAATNPGAPIDPKPLDQPSAPGGSEAPEVVGPTKPILPLPPPEPPTPSYECLLLDLCKNDEVPRHGWELPGRNLIDLESMKDQKLAVQFKGEEYPRTVTVKKTEFQRTIRKEFLECLVEIDGLIIIQDIGIDAPQDFDRQIIAICALVADAKGLGDAGKEIHADNFPVPVSILSSSGEGRPRKSSRFGVMTLVEGNTPFDYRFVRGLRHTADIADGIVELVRKIERRGPYTYRLVPGRYLPRPPPRTVPSTPQVRRNPEELSPALSTTLVTPHLALAEGVENVLPDVVAVSPNPDNPDATVITSEKVPAKARLGTPIPASMAPGMTASGSGGSLKTSASSSSLRRKEPKPAPTIEEAEESTEVQSAAPPIVSPTPAVLPKSKSSQSVKSAQTPILAAVIPPTPPPAVNPQPKTSFKPPSTIVPSFDRPPRPAPNPPTNPDEETVAEPYIPKITTAGEGDSMYIPYRNPNLGPVPPAKSIRSQKGVNAPAGPSNTRGKPHYMDFEHGFPEEEEEAVKPAITRSAIFAIFSKSKSKKGKEVDKRPGLKDNTFNDPQADPPSTVPSFGNTPNLSDHAIVTPSAPSGPSTKEAFDPSNPPPLPITYPYPTLPGYNRAPQPNPGMVISPQPGPEIPVPDIKVPRRTLRRPHTISMQAQPAVPYYEGQLENNLRMRELEEHNAVESVHGPLPPDDDRVFRGETFERMQREKEAGCCVML